MLKKTISYEDYDGNDRTENFYFNLSKAELMEMDYGVTGGMVRMLEKIVNERDSRKLIDIFKAVINKAYGEKSPDGRRFIKNQEVLDAFTQTEAYNNLFVELATDANAATAFINGIIPKNLQ